MEFCESGDLYTKINKQKGKLFPENVILHYFVQLCKAVQVGEHNPQFEVGPLSSLCFLFSISMRGKYCTGISNHKTSSLANKEP
jgi:hypothetical protein